MKNFIVIPLLLFCTLATAQKIGLVLSGGGAKGIAHIGVLKALEENEIPIDYIVGTSMGGIVGGCYAAGMSPEEIERMVLSDDFQRWVNGYPEKGVNYHYTKDEDGPYFLKLNLSLDSSRNFQFNSSLANDVSLNFALAQTMAQASAISNQNFDSLFVPYRAVAAEIFTQSQVILKSGSLSEALRATQTVPFFYNPIRVEGRYLFDGGVYNNFPVDIMQQDFNPDIIIGSNVSSKVFQEYPYKDDDKLINSSVMFMFLDKSDPTKVPANGVYIQPNLEGYSALDFAEVRALIDSGYNQTMRQITELKSKITNKRSCDEVTALRNHFRNKTKPWIFDKVTFKAFNSKQRKYIRRIFGTHSTGPHTLYFDDIRKGYFKLVSDSYFTNIFPTIHYNQQTERFNLQLTRRPQNNFQVDFGGVLSSRDISNIALGLNYYYFNRLLTHAYFSVQTGSFYKSAIARTRFDLPYFGQFYIQPEAEFNGWDYLEGEDLLQQTSPTVLKRFDRKVGLHIGKSIGQQFKGVLSVEGFSNNDRFSNKKTFISTDTLDEIKLSGVKTSFTVSMNDLNRKQYASQGKAYSLTASYFKVDEEYKPGNTSMVEETTSPVSHNWYRVKFSAEHYFLKRTWFRPGYFAEAVFSNQPYFSNYTSTIINAPAFFPLTDSRTLILENFRAHNYLAAGLHHVFVLNKRIDFRLDGYVFKPFDHLEENANQKAEKIVDFTKVFFAGTSSLIYHSPVGPVAINANYYDDAENELTIMVHVGFLLFNKHTLE